MMIVLATLLKEAPVNVGAPPLLPIGPHRRVSEMRAQLHRSAAADPGRRFDDLFNSVHNPATLLVAFERVAGNHGCEHTGRGRPDGRPRRGVRPGARVPGRSSCRG
jgi:hypothetical protein